MIKNLIEPCGCEFIEYPQGQKVLHKYCKQHELDSYEIEVLQLMDKIEVLKKDLTQG